MPILILCTKVYQNAIVNVAIPGKGRQGRYRDLQITNAVQGTSVYESRSAGAATIIFSPESGSSRINTHGVLFL